MSQLTAVTGRKYIPNIGAGIRAQAASLPAMYQLQDQREAQERSFDLERKGYQQNLELANKQMKAQQDQDKKSNILGMAGLGINYGLGKARNDTILADTGSNMAGDVSGIKNQFDSLTDFKMRDSVAPQQGFGQQMIQNYGGAIAGGLGGALMGGDTKEKIMYGLGGAAIGDLVSGGSLIKDVLGSAIDWGGTGITKLFGF